MSVRRRKEPIHQIFLLCSRLTPDPTWKDFLNQCSYGYFPSGVKFNNGNLVSSRKKNSFVIPVPEDPEQALIVLIDIFRDRLGIKSVIEKKSENLIFEKRLKSMTYDSWSEVKTKTGKASLLGNYVQAMANYYCMTHEEKLKALALLELCINFKSLGKAEIKVEGGKIVEIKNFHFDPISRQAFYSGKFNQTKTPLVPVPIYYDKVNQIDLKGKFMNALKEHSEKLNQASIH